jgi:hypothetical protein
MNDRFSIAAKVKGDVIMPCSSAIDLDRLVSPHEALASL